MFDRVWQTVWVEGFSVDSPQISPRIPTFGWDGVKTHRSSVLELLCSGCCFLDPVHVFVLLPRFIFTVSFTMASLRDLYKECQAVVRTLSLQFGKVKFNKSLCRLLTNKYVACLTYLDNYIFREDGSIDLPCKPALVELRRIMSCGQLMVTQWTQKDWWMSVITSSDSASLDKTVILHLREFLACVNVLVQMETKMTYGPALDSLDSSVQQACRTDIEGLILSMKQYRRGIIFTSKFAKLAKHLSEKLEAEISNHQHPYVIDISLDVEISYQDSLGSGSFGTVFKCTFLGVVAAAKVWKTNSINKQAAEKEASLFSKLRHPNVAQFIGYGVKESQPVIVSELMSTDLRRYLDEKKKNAGEGPPLPLLVALNILLQIAEAINYLHENGVMHRDLKANNALINVVEGPDGQLSSSSVQVKLTDFGESKLKLHDSGYTTPMVGATRWRAPEVFEVEENRKKYTKSADVYSFSMLCFEVLSGDVPFQDKPLGTLLESIRDGVRPHLPHADYCPDYLAALIEKCWATNPVERPQFPMICQLLVDYKARVLKHPYGQEAVPPDYPENLQAVDAADTDYMTYILEDDNNHHVREPASSCMQTPQDFPVVFWFVINQKNE
jgi:predicted Ser/Thr protein kinase